MTIGFLISVTFFGTVLYAFYEIFMRGVYRNLKAYELVSKKWQDITPGLISASITREEALAQLTSTESRILTKPNAFGNRFSCPAARVAPFIDVSPQAQKKTGVNA